VPMLRPISYVYLDCGVWIPDAETTWGESVTLNAQRDPKGRVVPWAAERSSTGSLILR